MVAPAEDLTWQASHELAAIQSYLGIIDASQKVCPCSQMPESWAGAVVHILRILGVCKLTSEEQDGENFGEMVWVIVEWGNEAVPFRISIK